MTAYPPYPHQAPAIAAAKAGLRASDNFLLQAPCAAGKTYIFSKIIEWVAPAGVTVGVVLDRNQLVTQTAESIAKFTGISDIGIACASVSKKSNTEAQIVVGSRQTLCRHRDFAPRLMIFDEAHLVNQEAGQYLDIFSRAKKNNPKMRLFGCTATPYQFGGYIFGPGRLWGSVGYKISAESLLAAGQLSPLVWMAPETGQNAELDNVRQQAGELNSKQQSAVVARYVQSVYDVWAAHCCDRKTAVFALNIDHAEDIAAIFRRKAIAVNIIHSKMTSDSVEAALASFRQSRNGVIINVGKLTIGSDIPDITAIILARRTLSTSLFYQMAGRGSRVADGKKDCKIIDLCGNWEIHGTDPDAPWINFRGEKNGVAPEKKCPECDAILPASRMTCDCGHEFPAVAEPSPVVHDKEDETRLGTVAMSKPKPAENVAVTGLRSSVWRKPGKPDAIRLDFFCGAERVASEWLAPESPSGPWPLRKTQIRWRQMAGPFPAPRTASEWVRRRSEITTPAKIAIEKKGRYLNVKGVIL